MSDCAQVNWLIRWHAIGFWQTNERHTRNMGAGRTLFCHLAVNAQKCCDGNLVRLNILTGKNDWTRLSEGGSLFFTRTIHFL